MPTLTNEQRQEIAKQIFSELSDDDAQWIWNTCIDLFIDEWHIKYHFDWTDSGMSEYKKHMIKTENLQNTKSFTSSEQ